MSIKNELTGRLVYTLDAVPITYEVREFRPATNEVILRRIFDTNGILLAEGAHTGNLKAANEDNFFSHY